jgi:hypothetical protein
MTTLQNVTWVIAIVVVGVCATTPIGEQALDRMSTFVEKHPRILALMIIPCVILLVLLGVWSISTEIARSSP